MKHHFIDVDSLASFVNNLIPLGLKQVNITGGEPTLHRSLLRIVKMFYDNQINVYLNTNGVLLNDDMCKKLAEYKKRLFLSVSIDGAVADTHDSIRGLKGAYDCTWNGIKALVRNEIMCEVIFTLQQRNICELEGVVQSCEENRIRVLRINLLQYSSGERVNDLKKKEGVLPIETILEVRDKIKELRGRYKINIMTNLPFAFYSPQEIVGLKHRVCGIKHAIGILPDGSISLCGVGELKSELIMGNIYSSSIEDIWKNNSIVEYIRNRLIEDFNGVCKSCTLRQICCGYCVAQNYMESGRLNSSYSLCEQLYQSGHFPKKYLGH